MHTEPYRLQRPIKSFERLMLRFGGAEILRKLTGKKLATESVALVYAWEDPRVEPFGFTCEPFLLAQSRAQFEERYGKERQMQLAVMAATQVRESVFANEMLQLYMLFSRALKDKEMMFPLEMQRALPKSARAYIEDINF